MLILDVGGNNGLRSRKAYPEASIKVLDKLDGFDVEKNELPSGNWDVILCNHIIEHLGDVDDFLEKITRVINRGVLEISTPNMCAWFNRLLFLFGYLPHSYEVSRLYNVGKAFGWNSERLGGHIRLFTPLALTQLLKQHGFKILSVKGERNTEYPACGLIKILDKVLTINPNLSSSFRIIARRL